MRRRIAIFAVFAAFFLVLSLNPVTGAVDTKAIDAVLNKAAGITEQLSSDPAANMKLAVRIAQALEKLVDRCSPETLPMMVEFAGAVKVSQAEKLLLRITDMRIKKYAEWSVEKELMDAAILRALFNKISSGRAGESTVARRFAQLYSYAIQRYYIGRDFLSESQKQHLISILVEAESSYISKLLGEPPQLAVRIKRALERNDYAALLLEHNRLLGDKTRAGQLGLKLKFDYGQNSDGTKRIEPLALPRPPSTIGK